VLILVGLRDHLIVPCIPSSDVPLIVLLTLLNYSIPLWISLLVVGGGGCHLVGDRQPGDVIRVLLVQDVHWHTPRPPAAISVTLSENQISRDRINSVVHALH
jgi:hypothetical protein